MHTMCDEYVAKCLVIEWQVSFAFFFPTRTRRLNIKSKYHTESQRDEIESRKKYVRAVSVFGKRLSREMNSCEWMQVEQE